MIEKTMAYIVLMVGILIFIFDCIRRSQEKFFLKNREDYTILDKDELYLVHMNRSILRLAGAIGFGICLFYDYNLIPITLYNFLPDFYFNRKSKDLYIDKTVDS
ncbi:hypothetical protein [Oceanirhabdus seepicola]|uniref:Uncharacterized protein n=1 Tax=Oceanirhabdus seepicola TaxID=2828781 RepID=A0A9J6P0U9_9CLOT|nr:hypothetical protein [Oceanirhabdus seepicola]MCM1989533.1 hypothetical protein [Oceanirhabdus seepicola]